MKNFPNALIGALILFSVPALYAQENIPVRKIPEFELVDQNAQKFYSSTLSGSVWIANFIFTRCQGMCPLMSGRMAELRKKLPNPGIKFISFSVDPEFDTPEVLKKYSERFGARSDQWLFLTGPREKMWELIVKEFQLGIDEASEEDLKQGAERVMHSNRFVLVGKDGVIRGYFDSSELDKLEHLAVLAEQLSEESGS